MNLKEIKEMISLMNDNQLVEIEIEKDGMRIRLKKESSNSERTSDASSAVGMPHFSVTQEKTHPSSAQEGVKKNLLEIKAPMVGTFYRSPSPESPPFVEIGQSIDEGQVVCIIEAMKLMNEIKSEVRGKIVEVIGENGHPIEYGQPLFLIEPT